MKHIGNFFQKRLTELGISKTEAAHRVGISINWMCALLKKPSVDAAMLNQVCKALGLNPCAVFDDAVQETLPTGTPQVPTSMEGRDAAAEQIKTLLEKLEDKETIIQEKERVIQLLMKSAGVCESGQNRDKDSK